MRRFIFLFAPFLIFSLFAVHLDLSYAAADPGAGGGGAPPSSMGDFRKGEEDGWSPPSDISTSFWSIYTDWVSPLRDVGIVVVSVVVIFLGLSALLGGGVERLQAIKQYLVIAAIALFLIWNAYPLARWLWDLFF